MTVYLITFLISVLFSYMAEGQYESEDSLSDKYVVKEKYIVNTERHTGYFFFLTGCVLILVAGLRYRVGTDYGFYYSRYPRSIANLPHSILALDEPGFGFLAWIVTRFVNDGGAVILVSSLVTLALPLMVIYRNTKKLALATALFIVTGFWHGSFNGVRQYLAAAILFSGYSFLKDRQFRQYCLVVFAAFLFHRSAIIMLPVYFIVHRKINQTNLCLTGAALALINVYSRFFLPIAGWIMEKQYSRDSGYVTQQVNILRIAVECIPLIIFLIMYWGEELSESETFSLNLLIIHVSLRVLTMNSALLYRSGIYTTLFAAMAIINLQDGLTDGNRKIIVNVITALYFCLWWYDLSASSSLNSFHWIWER